MYESIKNIIKARDKYKHGSVKWNNLNKEKAFILENIKPSLKEEVIYFLKDDIDDIPYGFNASNTITEAKQYVATRSLLEYNGECTRHLSSYCVVRYKDYYYFALRESGSTETQLIGGLCCIGGHINPDGIDKSVMRELKEEADITEDNIKNIKLIGTIKSNRTMVSSTHLGLVYEVELKNKNIRMYEKDTLTGLWLDIEGIHRYKDKFEDWAKLVIDKLFNF